MALLLAKGDDISTWRGVEEFISSYRDSSIKHAALHHPEGIAQFLELIEDQLEGVALENQLVTKNYQELMTQLHDCQEQLQIRNLLTEYYEHAYRHFRRFRSAPAFFEASNAALRTLVSAQAALVRQHSSQELPPLALLALGPAGRFECSRFSRLQLALVWEGTGSTAEATVMANFGSELVAWLRTCGISLDEAVTPLHADWRGTFADWQQRLDGGIARGSASTLVELLRLHDQAALFDSHGLASRFRTLCCDALHRRPALQNLVERCSALPGGLGMMGGFKLERSGPHRGKFALLDRALVPLAATVAAMSLQHDLIEDGTPRRLQELVRHGKIDVDLAERALQGWHLFSEYRLELELSAAPGQDCRDILNIDLSALSHLQQERFKDCLETVAALQRHLQVTFGQPL